MLHCKLRGIIKTAPEKAYIMIQRIEGHKKLKMRGQNGDRIKDCGEVHPSHEEDVVNIGDIMKENCQCGYSEGYAKRKYEDHAHNVGEHHEIEAESCSRRQNDDKERH